MGYIAIMKVEDNRVAKYAEFKTGEDAQAHIIAHAERWPDAFVVAKPSGNFADWWIDGKTLSVSPAPARVPDRVFPAQAEIALFNHDNGVLLRQVNLLIDAYPYEPVRIWWRKATYISRRHPYLEALAIELGLSDATVDALFLAAAKL